MELGEIVPWGRLFEEYRRMFALTEGDLAGRILGCGDGPASFNAEATAAGHKVVSCDPIYDLTADEIRQRVEDTYEPVISRVKQHPDRFVWGFFQDADDLGRKRVAAMERFLDDFERGKRDGRYVTGSLPCLPFADTSFRLALVSHLLFLYSRQLDVATHVASVLELLRVAEEVRIFPLVTLGRRWSPHVEPVRCAAGQAGHLAEMVEVPYEFRRIEGVPGSQMMRIVRQVDTPGACTRDR